MTQSGTGEQRYKQDHRILSGAKQQISAVANREPSFLEKQLAQIDSLKAAPSDFPTSGKLRRAAEGWTSERPAVHEAFGGMTDAKFGIDAPMNKFARSMEYAMRVANEEGGMPFAEKAFSEAQAFMRSQAPLPPTILTQNGITKVMPGSVKKAALDLHEYDNDEAMDLFLTFCGNQAQMLMQLAAKAGHPHLPFLYLNQALWLLLEVQDFFPKRSKKNPEFPDSHGDPRGLVQTKLQRWAGYELAKLITNRCYQANVSIECGIYKMCATLDKSRLADIDKAQKHQTRYQWAPVGKEDTPINHFEDPDEAEMMERRTPVIPDEITLGDDDEDEQPE